MLVYVHRDGTEYYCVRDEQARVGGGGGAGRTAIYTFTQVLNCGPGRLSQSVLECRVLLSGCVIQVRLSALSLAVQSVVEWLCHSGTTFCPVTGSVVTGTVQEPQLLKLHSARVRPQVQICCCEYALLLQHRFGRKVQIAVSVGIVQGRQVAFCLL